ncbi:hypothetical protein BegalDRAFT_0936 [Beggiatoa alba B18LD]|uniref:Uncharacterized protein n=1 Tax=Beggiatoa alba B18LD TaxID=395493 RepID=I3CE00_9GAMM|nr:zinc ribbon domain-containing protein [Beggiatoa alba]EIJ41843.1 hypothetical protein BegalDRAFT_0936 [Beggiatoa alba B18LD]
MISADLAKYSLLVGICSATASVLLNTAYAISLSVNVFTLLVFLIMWISFDLAKFGATSVMVAFWQSGSVGLAIITALLIPVLIGFSLFSGQGLLSKAFDTQETERLQASDAYLSAKEAQRLAQEKASSLAIDESSVERAKQRLTELNQQIQGIVASNAGYMSYNDGVCTAKTDNKGVQFKSRTDSACSLIMPLYEALKEQQAVINQYQQYQGALSYVQSLKAEPLPLANHSTVDPSIMSLSQVTGVDVQTAKAWMFHIAALILELVQIVFFTAYGTFKGGKQFELNDMISAVKQYKQFQQIAHDLEPMTKQSMTKGNDLEPMTSPSMTKGNDKKMVGGVYQCEECGTDYKARTVWQKKCPSCSAQTKRNVLARKSMPKKTA